MDSNELVTFEIEQFKNGWGKSVCFDSFEINDNVNGALKHALADAIGQGARRFKVEYKDCSDNICNVLRVNLINIASGKTKIKNQNDYKTKFLELKEKFFAVLKDNGLSKLAKFGFAQKFINMSFKYLYCFDDADRANLKYCHLPLDRFTIAWYKKYGEKSFIKEFKKIKYSWSNIEAELYFNIQDDIAKKLRNGINYPINCKDKKQTVKLPESRLEAEFIIWQQQRLIDAFKEIKKFKAYYDRLGVKEI